MPTQPTVPTDRLAATPVDLNVPAPTSGPQWAMQSDDLNATLLDWKPGEGIPEHVNDECDVLVIVLAGSASVSVDDAEHRLAAGRLILIARGARRAIAPGSEGVRYLSVHRRREPLLPTPHRAA